MEDRRDETMLVCLPSFEPRTSRTGSRSAKSAQPSITTLDRSVSQLSENRVGEIFSYRSSDTSYDIYKDSQTNVYLRQSSRYVAGVE